MSEYEPAKGLCHNCCFTSAHDRCAGQCVPCGERCAYCGGVLSLLFPCQLPVLAAALVCCPCQMLNHCVNIRASVANDWTPEQFQQGMLEYDPCRSASVVYGVHACCMPCCSDDVTYTYIAGVGGRRC